MQQPTPTRATLTGTCRALTPFIRGLLHCDDNDDYEAAENIILYDHHDHMVGKKGLAHKKYKNTKIQKSTRIQNCHQLGEKGLVHRVCETDYKGSCHGAGVYAGDYLYFCIFTFLYLKFCHGAGVYAGR